MKKTLQYTLLALVSWGVAIYGFTVIAPWTTAVPVSHLDALQQANANENWRSAIVDHGKVKEWSKGTIGMNPSGFWTYVSILGTCAVSAIFFAARSVKSHKTERDREGDRIVHRASF
ncbi:hypothetical protein OKA05_04910 [Luteolibacter arcticus]|uniref:Uncharacterized protein n=1 Tax=Luteolibacter arcticus TaxID=1581411 RepID=A0ABT3GE32_9BACT|nr:hypothetical protein [Luteolibacter arcticus]MCW1921880.1 hypothetical protein [Luteolibacter arcticus]